MGFPSRRRAFFGDQAVFSRAFLLFFKRAAPLGTEKRRGSFKRIPKESLFGTLLGPSARNGKILYGFWRGRGGVWVCPGGVRGGLGVVLGVWGKRVGVLGLSWERSGVSWGVFSFPLQVMPAWPHQVTPRPLTDSVQLMENHVPSFGNTRCLESADRPRRDARSVRIKHTTGPSQFFNFFNVNSI